MSLTPELLVALLNLGALGIVLAMIVRGDLRTRQEVETMQRLVDSMVPALDRAAATIREQTAAIKEVALMVNDLRRPAP